MQQLSAIDTHMLSMDTPATPNHMGAAMIYDPSSARGGRVTFKTILGNVARRLHLAAAFRRKLVPVPFDLDEPYWIEDPHFDLEYHVRHVALPKPGDWRQLKIQIARLHARSLDLSRPPWELTVIEGLDAITDLPSGAFALYLKIHHAAIDGVGGAEMITALHDLAPDARPPRTDRSWSPDAHPSAVALLARAWLNNLARPTRFARAFARTVPGMRKAGWLGVDTPTLVPHTRFNERPTAHRVFEVQRFSLADFKRIRAKVPGATVNDVALAIVSGALRRYLIDKDELPRASLAAFVPVSTRELEQAGGGGNQITLTACVLHTDVADPLERLAALHASMVQTKAYIDALGCRRLTELALAVPGRLQGLAARASFSLEQLTGQRLVANTLVTNVPGPQQPLYFGGARLVMSCGLAPLAGHLGIVHGISSYCGDITVSVVACRELLRDPDLYGQCLRAGFEELANAPAGALAPEAPPRRARRTGARARARA